MTKKIVELGKSLDTTLEPEELVAAVGVFGSLPTAQFVLSVLGGGGMSIDTYVRRVPTHPPPLPAQPDCTSPTCGVRAAAPSLS